MKQGDTLPPVEETLDTSRSLEDAGSVRFQMKNGGVVLVNSEASVVDADEGRVRYSWSEGDTDVIGTHSYEWIVEWPSDRETFPKSHHYKLKITQPLDR